MITLADECLRTLQRGVTLVTLGGVQGPYREQEFHDNYDEAKSKWKMQQYRDAKKARQQEREK